jgi:hypothetical protein
MAWTETWSGLKVRLVGGHASSPSVRQAYEFPVASNEHEYIAARQVEQGTRAQQDGARIDRAHTLIGAAGLALFAAGAGISWGWPYALLVVGSALLSGVIYARTRKLPEVDA